MKWLVSVFVVVGLGFYSLPYIVRDQVVIWLNQQGAESASFKDLSINWLTGEVELIELKASAQSKPELNLDRLAVGVDYPSLAEKKILIKRLELDGLHSGLLQQNDGTWLGPINLTELTTAETKESETASDDQPFDWLFGISEVAIQDLTWSLKTPELKQDLVIENAGMSSLMQWQAERPTQLNLTGMLNGAGFDIETDATPLPEKKETALQLKLNAFPLESVLQPWVPDLKGRLTTNLDIKLVLNGQSIAVHHSGSIQLKNLDFKQEELQVQNQSLVWKGKGSASLEQQAVTHTKLSGELSLSGSHLQQQELTALIKTLDWQGDVDLKFKEGALNQVSSNTGLLVNNLDLDVQGQKVLAQSITVKTPLNLSSSSQSLDRISASPKVSLQALTYQQGQKLAVDIKQGESSLSLQDMAFDQIAIDDIQTRLSNLDVSLPEAAYQLASVQALQLDNARYSADSISFSGFSLDEIKASRKNDDGALYLSEIDNLKVTKLNFADLQKLEVDQVAITNSRSILTRNKQEKITEIEELLSALSTLQKKDTSVKSETPKADEKPTEVKVNELVMLGNQTIKFADASVKPKFSSTAVIDELSLKGINTASDNLMPFVMKAVINEHSKVSAEGEMNLLGGTQNGRWELTLENVGLPVVSPYAGKYVGYYLKRGQMNFNSTGEMKNGDLSGTNKIVLNRLDVQPAKTKATDNFNEKLKMPLGTAIAILQDDKDNIELDIPVEGSLNDPKFGYQSIINRLASKGLKKAALGFLTKSLQPYGALISIASTAISANQSGAFINLAPVDFEPGQKTLSSDMQGYLAKVAEMLNSREGLRLNLCGNAVYDDKAALLPAWEKENKARKKPLDATAFAEEVDNRLQALATERNEAVIGQLLKARVDKARVFACFPVLDFENKELKASATLGL